MSLDTVWGTIKFRSSATRLSQNRYILLKDNPQLKLLFQWLKVRGIRRAEDLKDDSSKLIEVERCYEFRFSVDPDERFPMLVFSNRLPLRADFERAIPEVLKVFYKLMYSPDGRD